VVVRLFFYSLFVSCSLGPSFVLSLCSQHVASLFLTLKTHPPLDVPYVSSGEVQIGEPHAGAASGRLPEVVSRAEVGLFWRPATAPASRQLQYCTDALPLLKTGYW